MLIQEYLHNSAELFPDKAAIIQTGREITYGEILQQARSVSQWLIKRNLQPGDRVAILIDDPSEYVIAYFSILMAGGIVVALNTQTSSRTLKYIFNDCRISIALTHIKFIKYIRECADELLDLRLLALLGYNKDLFQDLPFTCADLKAAQNFSSQNSIPDHAFSDSDISQIIYTSGTTSKPKGVMLRHSNLAANTRSIIKYLKLGPDERHMVVLPFFFSFCNTVLLKHFAVGATHVVHQSFN
jgi:long-chain acyl-CoA synthetase